MIHKPNLIAAAVAIFTVAGGMSSASDMENGQKLARKCSACHGKQGISRDPEVPIIAGQHAFYLEKALKDYREGKREDRRMSFIVKPLSDDDISDLATYFAAFEVSIK